MGQRGPVPKSIAEVIGHITQRERDQVLKITVPQQAAPDVPPRIMVHPTAARWYESLKQSGQSQFYQPSDWALAQWIAQLMTAALLSPFPTGSILQAIDRGMDKLLVSEASRRRVGLEITNAPVDEEPALGIAAISDYRRQLIPT